MISLATGISAGLEPVDSDLRMATTNNRSNPTRDYVSKHVRDGTIRCVFQRPLGSKAPYIGFAQLKETQRRLQEELDNFIERHRRLLESFRLRARLAFDSDKLYGPTHYKLYVNPPLRISQLDRAMSDLEQITSSDLWSDEIKRSKENIAKRSALGAKPA
jgi:hypothetical protein